MKSLVATAFASLFYILVAPSSAQSGVAGIERMMNACFNAPDSFSQMESCIFDAWQYCRDTEWDGAGVSRGICNDPLIEQTDNALNDSYRKLIDRLSELPWADTAINDLKTAQRSWISTRDLTCEFYENSIRGTGSTHHATCIAKITMHRIWLLNDF